MRNRFVQLLLEWAQKDKNIYLLTADLGFSVLEPFAEAFPDRFINVGIAEQNMIGLSAGLSLRGKRVFVYSIVNFATLRCFEQIRNDICYHNANVIVTVVGAGLAYGVNGYTHLGIEDLSAMMCLPKMRILSPADNYELEGCMRYIRRYTGPMYLRLAKGGEPAIHNTCYDIEANPLLEITSRVNIICHGTILYEIKKAQRLLQEQHNIEIGVFSFPLLKPLQKNKCLNILQQSSHVFLIEEHIHLGGLTSNVAALAASLGPACPFIHAYTLDEKVMHLVGDQSFLRCSLGFNAESLIKIILTQLINFLQPEINLK
jgi:transketolase